MHEAKPYQIPKRLVWEAYRRVKANRGAAGTNPWRIWRNSSIHQYAAG